MKLSPGCVLLLLMMGGPTALLAKETPAAIVSLESELRGQVLQTRAPLTTSMQFYDDSLKRNVLRRVDTEVDRRGALSYLCTKVMTNLDGSAVVSLTSLLGQSFYVESRQANPVAPGSDVRFMELDVKRDRLELVFRGGGESVRVKLMLGKGYARSATTDSLLDVLSAVVLVPSHEKVRTLRDAYAAAVRRVEAARSRFGAATDSVISRLEAGERLRSALLEEEELAGQLADAGRPQPNAATLADERVKVDEELGQIRAAARDVRVAAIGTSLTALASDVDGVLARVKASPSTEREGLLGELEDLLERRDVLLSEYATVNAPAPPEQTARQDKDREMLLRMREQLAAEKEAGERERRLAQLDAVRSELEAAVATARASYAGAFGTLEQVGKARRLLAELERLHENRAAAARAGSSQASRVASDLQKEIEGLKRQVR